MLFTTIKLNFALHSRHDYMKLALNSLIKFVSGAAILALLLFLPAGTFCFAGAWRLIALLFIPMTLLGAALLIWAPKTLERRLKSKENRKEQSVIVKISGLLFVASFIIAGLDFRYSWSVMPAAAVWAASIIFLLSYGLYAEVIRENEWLSRTIEVSEGQKVISTGLYGVVRHPMYTATVIMFLSMPLVLGSWPAFFAMLPYLRIIACRIKDEEKLLNEKLDGYGRYCKKVRWRLLPFIW